MSVGQELLDVPFPDMVYNLANAIANGQRKLDYTSINTARALAKAKVKVIPEIFEIVEYSDPEKVTVNIPKEGDPKKTEEKEEEVKSIKVRATEGKEVEYTLLQAGLMPTFYQFTESIIEVKISISSRTASSSEFEIGASASVTGEAGANFGFGSVGGSATFSSHVNYKTSNTYSHSVEGSSLLRTTLKPVPPPARLVPRIITIDATKNPPLVTFPL